MILHIDMDAFYASVEEREEPTLKGCPLVVGGSPNGRGVVAAANYAARAFGIRSAMPAARALRLCPGLVFIRPRGALYSQVSSQIREIFERYTPIIEPLSLDEAFLDARGSEKLYGSAEKIGRRIKQEIRQELELIASVGVAPNKFLAKLASDQDKPDGFTVVKPEEIQQFLDPLPVSRIWGIGKVAQEKLHAAGIFLVRDLRLTSREYLEQSFGKNGNRLWDLCHGRDQRAVAPDHEAKSISRETTFDIDVVDFDHLSSIAMSLTESNCYRLRKAGLRARTVQIKVRYHDFSTVTRVKSLTTPTDATLEIWRAVRELMGTLPGKQRFSVRLIGVALSGFGEKSEISPQTDLFSVQQETPDSDSLTDKHKILDNLSDEFRVKFGKGALKRGRSV